MLPWLMSAPPGMRTFAEGSQRVANMFTDTEWNSGSYYQGRSLFILILQDLFMADGYLNFPFGVLGENGPRKQGIPAWIRTHQDPAEDWFRCPNDIEDSPSGRRDHFLANASFTPLGGFIVQNIVYEIAGEDSCGDRKSNELGTTFGWRISRGTIEKNNVGNWIQTNLGR